jgi:hypothetical protein
MAPRLSVTVREWLSAVPTHAGLAATALGALLQPAAAQTRVVTGQTGILGEWELTATVTARSEPGGPWWSGPLSLRHVGFCDADGPELKTGDLRLRFSDPPTAVTATLIVEGVACHFEGRLNDGFNGVLACPGRRDVPMMLTIE